MRYASETVVPVERSRAEIEGLLVRYGASQFHTGWMSSRATWRRPSGTTSATRS